MKVFHTKKLNEGSLFRDHNKYDVDNEKEAYETIVNLCLNAKYRNLIVKKSKEWFECTNDKGEVVEWFGIKLE